jgi:hypothetical protein
MSPRKLLPGLIDILTGRRLPRERTDVDFRPPPQPEPDVIAGWERPPRVPGANHDDHVR